jgi:hypothetical protein
MTEDTATAEAPVETEAKAAKPRRVAAVVQLVDAAGNTYKAIKYPMPLKAVPYELSVNGERVVAAQTTFGEIKYTYVTIKGCSFYCPGHHADDQEYTFQAPEGYSWEPLKLDRKEQSAKAAAAKAAKAATATGPEGEESPGAGEESAPAGDETGGTAPDSPEAAAAVVKKGKKASR